MKSNEEIINEFLKKVYGYNIKDKLFLEYPIKLKKEEKISIILNKIILFEPKLTRNVMMSCRGLIIPQNKNDGTINKIKKIDEGTFILTNQRIIFNGTKKSKNIDLKEIKLLEPCDEGIIIQKTN